MPVTPTGGGALEFDALIKDSQFEATFKKIERQLLGLTDAAEKEGRAIENYAKKASQAIAAYFSFSTATSFIQDVIRVRGEFQQLEVAFNTMLGSKAAADRLLAEATELAAKTPFTLQDVGAGAKQLLAYGFGAEEITETLRRLGDVAAGVGAPLNDIVYLYGTTRTQGRLYAQDLMQFTSRGIPIIAELAKQFKVTEGEVKKLVEAGKVGFPEVEKVIKSLTSQGGLFFNLMEEQSKTLTGQISNLQDAWDRMLNEIGKENQGVLSGSIQLAIDLVENYQTVIDILKVLVITYGSYRAAIIATNAVTAISTTLSKGWTIAETLRFQAMVISDRAMKILNATMLNNPAVAITTGIVALASALLIFGKRASAAEESQKRLNSVQEDAERSMLKEKATLEQLLKTARDETKTREDQLEAVRKLNAIAPETLGNLTLENLKTQEGVAIIEAYVKALEKKAKAQAAENALQAIAEERLERELEFRRQQEQRLRGVRTQDRDTFVANDPFLREAKESFEEDMKRLAAQQKAIEEYINNEVNKTVSGEKAKQEAKKRTIDVIDDEIKELRKRQSAYSSTNPEFAVFEKQIKERQRELALIKGEKTKEDKAEETEAEKRAKKLKALEEQIADAERRALQSGLVKEESKIDKLNADYDELRKKVAELGGDKSLLTRIDTANTAEVGNERIREEVKEYEKSLDAQRVIFEEYENAKKEFGIETANSMFAEQTKGFDSFLEYLKMERLKFSEVTNPLRRELSLEAIGNATVKEQNEQIKSQLEEQIKAHTALLKATESFRIKEKEINDRYDKLEATNNKTSVTEGYTERVDFLKESREQELNDLKNSATRQSGVYKNLNQDIIRFTREQLKQRVKDLEPFLENTPGLTPQMKADIMAYIEQLKDLLDETSKAADIARDFAEVGAKLMNISGAFHTLAFDVEEMNEGLADTLATLGDIVGIAGSASNAIASFAKKDFVGGIASTAQAIVGIFSLGKKARESERQAAAQMAAFQQQILAGEREITAQYRERERAQVSLNKLKLQGLRDEKKLLEEQKKAVERQYNDILSQLQQQQYIVSQTTEKYGGFLGIGRKTRVNNVLGSLAGTSFEELEKLFNTGRLTDQAAQLFQQLQKIKQEGVDIDALLARNAELVKEAFTGTTADSITDAILEGFKNGKKGAMDFADDFESLMQDALLQSLKFQALEGPLKEFYEQFAANAESDGILTEEEIRLLRERFNSIIQSAGEKFDELQQITNIDLAGGGSGAGGGSSLAGAIKGMTQQQADLLAGQFGGLRLTALDQLNVARQELASLQAIQNHTAHIESIYRLMQRVETNGLKVL